MNTQIRAYNDSLSEESRAICNLLYAEINRNLPEAESKIWHAHPVWFLDGNPIVGYSNLKSGIRLLFWSGASFEDEKLQKTRGKFQDASISFTSVGEINYDDLARWLQKAKDIQWDYKNIVKRKGLLIRLK